MSADQALKTPEWRALCVKFRREAPPYCWICNEEIDLNISGREKRGWTLDHKIPRAKAPHLVYEESNLAPAHNICNVKKGASSPSPINYSQKWG